MLIHGFSLSASHFVSCTVRKFLKIRAEVLHIPVKQYQSLQAVTYHVFSSYPVQEIQAGKISVRSDILKQMFDFYDQISASRHYPSLEQTNLQARGIGNNINFCNRLRAICPKGVMYNGPILNSQGDHCTTSHMLDEAMLDTRKLWFVEPIDQFRE